MSKNVRFLFWSAAMFLPVESALGATGMTVTLDRRDTGTSYPLSMEFWVRGTLTGDASQGLAGFAFDLMGEAVEIASGEPVASFDVSAAVVTLSSAPAMPSFAPNLGFSNPGGFAGTAVDSQRRQIGGAQNTMGNDGTLYPFPAGAVVKTVGQPGPQVLAVVTLTIPSPPAGQKYVITAHNFVGSVLDPMQDGPTYKSTMLDEVSAVSIDAVLNGACCLEAGSGECLMRPEHECGQFVCNVADFLPDKFKGCLGDVDGNGVVNAADRGFISASIGTTKPSSVCLYDLDGNGFVNAADRGFVSAAIGLCVPLENFQNGSGCNGPNCPDPRFTGAGYTGNYIGDGSDCASLPCSGGGGGGGGEGLMAGGSGGAPFTEQAAAMGEPAAFPPSSGSLRPPVQDGAVDLRVPGQTSPAMTVIVGHPYELVASGGAVGQFAAFAVSQDSQHGLANAEIARGGGCAADFDFEHLDLLEGGAPQALDFGEGWLRHDMVSGSCAGVESDAQVVLCTIVPESSGLLNLHVYLWRSLGPGGAGLAQEDSRLTLLVQEQ